MHGSYEFGVSHRGPPSAVGHILTEPHLMALSAVGGLILIGLGLRILNARKVPVMNLLPALVIAPALVELVAVLR